MKIEDLVPPMPSDTFTFRGQKVTVRALSVRETQRLLEADPPPAPPKTKRNTDVGEGHADAYVEDWDDAAFLRRRHAWAFKNTCAQLAIAYAITIDLPDAGQRNPERVYPPAGTLDLSWDDEQVNAWARLAFDRLCAMSDANFGLLVDRMHRINGADAEDEVGKLSSEPGSTPGGPSANATTEGEPGPNAAG